MSFLNFEKRNSSKENFEEETEKEEVDLGENRVEIELAGQREFYKHFNADARKIDKMKIIGPEGKSFDIVSLLPKDFAIKRIEGIQSESMVMVHSYKAVFFPKKQRTEILHFLKEEDENEPEYYQNEKGGRKKGQFSQSYVEWQNVDTLKRAGAFFDILHEIGHTYIPLSKDEENLRNKLERNLAFSEEEKKQYFKVVLKTERKAWAYALSKYRQLKKDGIDIFPEAENNEYLFDYISNCLKNYVSAYYNLQTEGIEEKKLIKEVLSCLRELFKKND